MAGRTASGESSIFKGYDGRWHGFVSLGLKRDGARDRRHVSGQRRADVVHQGARPGGLTGRRGGAGQRQDAHRRAVAAATGTRRSPRRGCGRRRSRTTATASATTSSPTLAITAWTGCSPSTSRLPGETLRRGLVRGDHPGQPPDPVPGPQGRHAARTCQPQRRDAGRCPHRPPARGGAADAARRSRPSWLQRPPSRTRRGGRSRWRWAFARARPSGCSGRTSTWTPTS